MNRIDFNGKRISDQNERFRSTVLCKEITIKHSLYVSSGKENVKREQLREPDATKYQIYDALCKHVPQSKSWQELRSRLRTEGIELGFKTKGSTDQIEGVRFTMNNLSFNGSKVDRQFSYSKIDYALRQNNRAEQQSLTPMQQLQHRPITTKPAPLAILSARSSTYRCYPTAQTPKRRHSANVCNAKRKKESDFNHIKI